MSSLTRSSESGVRIRSCNDDAYGSTIIDAISRAFPANLDDSHSVLEGVTAALVGTGQTRNGPSPSPEALVGIRKVITTSMGGDLIPRVPIRILVPWGSKKAVNGVSVDIAEVAALKTLESLASRVTRFYEPGVEIRIAVEDAGGYYLWADEGNETLDSSRFYTNDFVNLVKALDLSGLMNVVPESTLGSQDRFNMAADFIRPALEGLLLGTGGIDELRAKGWRGDLPPAQVLYYMKLYEHQYPYLTTNGRLKKLAMYLAQSWARYHLGLKADPKWGDNYIQVNFTDPIPGIPADLAARRLFYRTLPTKFGKTHLPPWRAKGYMAIDGDTATPKLTTFRSADALDLTEHEVVIESNDVKVNVRADYEVRS